jgi:AcrR family transcriptional regulator
MPESNIEAADKRVQRSKESVLQVTYKLLSEGGIGGVSIDEVSRRSGVSKTTIYRHWPSRSALLLDACSKIGGPPEVPDTGSLLGDVTALATDMARQLQSARWPAVLPSIIDAAERDSKLAQLHAKLHAGLMHPFAAVIERAQKKGELSPDHEVSDVVAAIVGPLFYRRWFSKEPIDSQFVKSVVRSIVDRTSPK